MTIRKALPWFVGILASSILAWQGYTQLRANSNPFDPYENALVRAEKIAQQSQLGLWQMTSQPTQP